MVVGDSLTRDMTNAIRGVSALGVLLFHVILSFVPSPITNFWGGVFVAIFLILSGYGINESYKRNGLSDYWKHRWHKVLLPTIIFACLFNWVNPKGGLENLFLELSYGKPTYWFVFHVLKCYAVYWVSMRFCKRWAILLMCGFAIFCLNYNFCGCHLESEQAFSFLFGVLLSRYKEKIPSLSRKWYWQICALLFGIGLMLFLMKLIPSIYACKGTVTYNYLQCPFRLTWGVALLMLLLKIEGLQKNKAMQWLGRHSLELYVSHIPLIVYLAGDMRSLSFFLLISALSFIVLVTLDECVLPNVTAPVTAYIIINALFVSKYSARIFPNYVWLLTTFVMIFHYSLLTMVLPRIRKVKTYAPIIIVGFMGVCAMLFLQYMINPYEVQVDRWSALHNPIANLLAGEYPYLAPTHLDGYASPFPIWQLFHVPFFLLGNVGLSFFFVQLLFFYSIYRLQGHQALLVALLLIFCSPAVWYEVAVRSDLITNILLVGVLLNIVIQKISVQWFQHYVVPASIIVALLACTRVVSLLPIAILLFPYYIKMGWKQQIVFFLCLTISFVMTFLPFALWDPLNFFYFEYNPWSLQTGQGNSIDFILFIPLGIYLSLQWNGNHANYYRNTIILLIIFVAITFAHNMINSGNYDLFCSAYDITYFSTALPFCILGLINSIRE